MTAAAKLGPMGHHNRSQQRRGPLSNPTPAEVLAARQAASLTQEQAAEKVRARLRSWQHWEGERDTEEHRNMPPGLFELFLIKTGQPLPAWMKEEG